MWPCSNPKPQHLLKSFTRQPRIIILPLTNENLVICTILGGAICPSSHISRAKAIAQAGAHLQCPSWSDVHASISASRPLSKRMLHMILSKVLCFFFFLT
jgi:hypothetical protein